MEDSKEPCLHEWVEQRVGCCKKWVCTKCPKMWMGGESPHIAAETSLNLLNSNMEKNMKIDIDSKTSEILITLRNQFLSIDEKIKLVCKVLINSSDEDKRKHEHWSLSDDCKALLPVGPVDNENALGIIEKV